MNAISVEEALSKRVLPPFCKGVYSERKECAPLIVKSLILKLLPFHKGIVSGGSKRKVTKVVSLVKPGGNPTSVSRPLTTFLK